MEFASIIKQENTFAGFGGAYVGARIINAWSVRTFIIF